MVMPTCSPTPRARSLRRLLFAAALTASGVALAADAPAPPAAATPDAKCSCGGRDIDLAKMDERAAKEFAAADTNHDGKVSLDEFEAYAPAHRGMAGRTVWVGHDHGHEAATSADQQARDARRQQFDDDLFAALDTDHNGQISKAEFADLTEATRNVSRKLMFAKLDANHDGALEKGEFPPYPERLAALDTNGDGKVSRDEMKAAHQAKAAQTAPDTSNH